MLPFVALNGWRIRLELFGRVVVQMKWVGKMIGSHAAGL
jgi:hypothetical protein